MDEAVEKLGLFSSKGVTKTQTKKASNLFLLHKGTTNKAPNMDLVHVNPVHTTEFSDEKGKFHEIWMYE